MIGLETIRPNKKKHRFRGEREREREWGRERNRFDSFFDNFLS